MAFGKRKNPEQDAIPALSESAPEPDDDLDGPFDIEDFDDPETATVGRLDLGAVLIPIPEAGQVQVEVNEAGVPNAVWVVTPNGRYTIAAFAAPKTAGLWREVAPELADALRKDTPNVSVQSGAIRFIGVDGYRWMIRCVINGARETFGAVEAEARKALADTVVRRGDTPLPVRTPLPVQLPEAMAEQLRAAAQQAFAAAQAQQTQPVAQELPADAPEPIARRGAQGSAMQQLRGVTGG